MTRLPQPRTMMTNSEHYWWVTQPYSSRNFLFPAPQSSCTAIHLLQNQAHTSHLLSALRYLTLDIPSATLELRQRLRSSPNASWGQPFEKTDVLGPELANPRSAPRFLATLSLHFVTFPSYLPASYKSTLIWSVFYRPRQDFNIALLLWTASRTGRQPFLIATSQQRRYHAPYFPAGCISSAVHRPSWPNKDASLILRSFTAWSSCVVFISAGCAPTILQPVASWNGYTARLKPPSCAIQMDNGPRLSC